MNKNNVKIIIIVVCLLGAGLLIMWQTGVIGGGSSTANAPTGNPETDAQDIAGTTEDGQPPAAGALYKDRN